MIHSHPHNSFLSNITMTKTKTSTNKRRSSGIKCKLNPLTFRKMVTHCLRDIYGEENRYFFQRPALLKLQQAAEQYIEIMRHGIKDIVLAAGRREVLPRDIREWKLTNTDFNILLNRKTRMNGMSLCNIFNSFPKKSKVTF